MIVLITATTYPKSRSLTLILPLKMEIFNLSFKFDYIAAHGTTLVLMVKSVIIYNIHYF